METIIDWLAGRKHIERAKEPGISLAIQTIEEFTERTFSCPETTPKTSGIRRQEILKLIKEELPSYYNYTTRVKKYVDRRGTPQAEIELIGSLSVLERYNPFNRRFHIGTETPKSHVS
jgi:hypothetical protein